jgi:hypothetical protein
MARFVENSVEIHALIIVKNKIRVKVCAGLRQALNYNLDVLVLIKKKEKNAEEEHIKRNRWVCEISRGIP